MKVSVNWLSSFFPGLAETETLNGRNEAIREALPFLGLEIGSYEKLGAGLESIVVAQIESFEKHPQADKLNVCKVNRGDEVLQIVCGAPNVSQGMKVALAPVGSVLPGDFKIKPAKIRGVESFGMLCSEKELGLSDESEGIMSLDQALEVGKNFLVAMQISDEIWDIELTPDRADCLSHLGVVREIAPLISGDKKAGVFKRAKQALPWSHPEYEELNSSLNEVPLFSLEVQDEKACPQYSGVLLEGVDSTDSPAWMKQRLESLGHRTHNALVDISNYVVQELGHPLHSFDADKVAGSKLIVRFAKEGETLTTLDEEERQLTSEDLIIADIEKPLALAGVMGGLDSGVSTDTKRILLESAVFDPTLIRKMAARHKIHSEASHRFERGVDWTNALKAAGRACRLYKEITGAKRRGAMVESRSKAAKEKAEATFLNFDLRAFTRLVGIEASAQEIAPLFESVGIHSTEKSAQLLRVEVPSHRVDLEREVDLIEEAARLLGYDQIPELYPVQQSQSVSFTSHFNNKVSTLRERVLDLGLCEVMPYCFASQSELDLLSNYPAVELSNPLSEDWQFLRPNLSIGLLKSLKQHVAIGQNSVELFDLGHTFSSKTDGNADEKYKSGVTESLHIAWAQLGERYDKHWSNDKRSHDRKTLIDFYDAKGVFEEFKNDLASLEGRWSGAQFLPLNEVMEKHKEVIEEQAPWIPVGLLHPSRSALIVWPGRPPGSIMGFVGELHPKLQSDLLNLPAGLSIGAAIGELRVVGDIGKELSELRANKGLPKAAPPNPYGKISLTPRTPVVERDISLVFGKEVAYSSIAQTLKKAVGKHLISVSCMDVFPLEGGKESIALRLRLQDAAETLSDKEIQHSVETAIQSLQKQFSAEIRS